MPGRAMQSVMWRRLAWIGLAAILVQHALVIGPRVVRTDCPIRGVDAATYVQLSQALSEGKGYVEPWTPGHPPYTIAPPLLPALLALIRLGGGGVAAFYAFVLACSMLALALIWLYFRPLLGEGWALAVTAATALTPVFMQYSGRIFAEMPYTVLLFGALLLLRSTSTVPSYRRAIAAALVVGAVTMIKSVGLALLPAAAIHVWYTTAEGQARWRRSLLVGIIASIPFAVWVARNQLHGVAGGTTYVKFASQRDENDYDQGTVGARDLIRRCGANLSFYSQQLTGLCAFDTPASVPRPWSAWGRAAVPLVIVLGAVVQTRRRKDPGAVFFAGCLCILVVYVASTLRYLIPLFPFALTYFLTGAKSLVAWCFRSPYVRRAAALTVTVGLLVVWFYSRLGRHEWAISTYLEESILSLSAEAEGQRMKEWLDGHAGKEDVILCWLAPVTALTTGHECVEYERRRDPEALERVLERYRVRWILLGHPTEIEKAIEAHLASDPSRFTCAWAGNSMRLYSVGHR